MPGVFEHVRSEKHYSSKPRNMQWSQTYLLRFNPKFDVFVSGSDSKLAVPLRYLRNYSSPLLLNLTCMVQKYQRPIPGTRILYIDDHNARTQCFSRPYNYINVVPCAVSFFYQKITFTSSQTKQRFYSFLTQTNHVPLSIYCPTSLVLFPCPFSIGIKPHSFSSITRSFHQDWHYL
jgi:hypothetical protein